MHLAKNGSSIATVCWCFLLSWVFLLLWSREVGLRVVEGDREEPWQPSEPEGRSSGGLAEVRCPGAGSERLPG